MKPLGKQILLLCCAAILIAIGLRLVFRSAATEITANSEPGRPEMLTRQGSVSAAERGRSPAELAQYIRQLASSSAPTDEIYRKIASLGLNDRPWWQASEETSALLELALDTGFPEEIRILAMSLYLAAANANDIRSNSATIQEAASKGSDRMVNAVLQGMADRAVAPGTLIKATLTSTLRGTGAKCHAWYAARLTQRDDSDLARLALDAQNASMTEATKVALDYLASGSYAPRYTSDRSFQEETDALLNVVKSLPAESGPMGLANGDAFIRAIPSITPPNTAIASLFTLLQEAQHPEMRLSAIEQLVTIHLSGAKDLTQELHEVRNQIAALFSDPVKQDRAKLRLNRIQSNRR